VLRGSLGSENDSPGSENEKEQTSLLTAKIAGKLQLPLSWLPTSAKKLSFFNSLSKPSPITHWQKQGKVGQVTGI
jgi:hypothetical protein